MFFKLNLYKHNDIVLLVYLFDQYRANYVYDH